MENNGDFGRFVCTNSSPYLFSVPGDKNGLPSTGRVSFS